MWYVCRTQKLVTEAALVTRAEFELASPSNSMWRELLLVAQIERIA